MVVLTVCLSIGCVQNRAEKDFTGEYVYWSRSGDFESVSFREISGGRRRIQIRCKSGTISLTGRVDGAVLTSSEDTDGTSYVFRSEGGRELRMRKLYRDYTSPEDIEWVFYREP